MVTRDEGPRGTDNLLKSVRGRGETEVTGVEVLPLSLACFTNDSRDNLERKVL